MKASHVTNTINSLCSRISRRCYIGIVCCHVQFVFHHVVCDIVVRELGPDGTLREAAVAAGADQAIAALVLGDADAHVCGVIAGR